MALVVFRKLDHGSDSNGSVGSDGDGVDVAEIVQNDSKWTKMVRNVSKYSNRWKNGPSDKRSQMVEAAVATVLVVAMAPVAVKPGTQIALSSFFLAFGRQDTSFNIWKKMGWMKRSEIEDYAGETREK